MTTPTKQLITNIAKFGVVVGSLWTDNSMPNPRKKKSNVAKLKAKKYAKRAAASKKRNRK